MAAPPPPPLPTADDMIAADRNRKRKVQEAYEKRKQFEATRRARWDSSSENNLLPCDIDAIPWASIVDYDRVAGGTGSEGVTFVKTQSNGVFVVKGSKTPEHDLFATHLARTLDIPTPKVKVLVRLGDQYLALVDSLLNVRSAYQDEANPQLDRMLRYPFLLVQEWVPGISGKYFSREMAMRTFGDDGESNEDVVLALQGQGCNHDNPGADLIETGREKLRVLGRIMAMDVLLNNFDRLPRAFQNSAGNAGNILISAEAMIAIDTEIGCIEQQHEDRLTEYLTYIDEVLEDAQCCLGDSAPGRNFRALQDFLFMSWAWNIGNAGLQVVAEGFLAASRRLSTWNDLSATLADVRTCVVDAASHAPADSSVEFVELGEYFLNATLERFRVFPFAESR